MPRNFSNVLALLNLRLTPSRLGPLFDGRFARHIQIQERDL